MKKLRPAAIYVIVASVIAGAGALGFAVDRPVLYRAEFLPVAKSVEELRKESISNKLQRAIEWKERTTLRNTATRAKGVRVEPEDVENQRYWSLRVRALKQELKELDK